MIAAGALCWRVVDGRPELLLVHRERHDDVSLPKGKLEPGESLPAAAVREIAEETSLHVALGAPLGTVEYELPSKRQKVVHYWSAEVESARIEQWRFESNDEVTELEWASPDAARSRLSYEHDLKIIDRFEERFEAGTARTFAIIALRHAKAVPPSEHHGPDAARPLLKRGEQQAKNIVPGLAAYGPAKIVSSTATRCLATVRPLAKASGLPVKQTAALSQDAHMDGRSDAASVVEKRLRKQRTAVVCSHSPVLPEIAEELARLTGAPAPGDLRRAAMLGTGCYSVFHVPSGDRASGIVAVETHGPTV